MSEQGFNCPRDPENNTCAACNEVAKLAIEAVAINVSNENPALIGEILIDDVIAQLPTVKMVGEIITCRERRDIAESTATVTTKNFLNVD